MLFCQLCWSFSRLNPSWNHWDCLATTHSLSKSNQPVCLSVWQAVINVLSVTQTQSNNLANFPQLILLLEISDQEIRYDRLYQLSAVVEYCCFFPNFFENNFWTSPFNDPTTLKIIPGGWNIESKQTIAIQNNHVHFTRRQKGLPAHFLGHILALLYLKRNYSPVFGWICC